MSFLKTWAPHFQSAARAKGRQDQLAGCVTQLPIDGDDVIRAQVTQDDQTYTVTVEADAMSVTATCTCHEFANGSYCRHIWATLLDVQNNPNLQSQLDRQVSRATTHQNTAVAMPKARKRTGERSHTQAEPEWVSRLTLLHPPAHQYEESLTLPLLGQHQLIFVIDPDLCARHRAVVLEVQQRQPTATGWSRGRSIKLDAALLSRMDDPISRELGATLLGGSLVYADEFDQPRSTTRRAHNLFQLHPGSQRKLLKRMVDAQRCFVQLPGHNSPTVVSWEADDEHDAAWQLWMVGRMEDDAMLVALELRRGDRRVGIDRPTLVLGGPDGVVLIDQQLAPFDDRGATRWVTQFRDDHRSGAGVQPLHVPGPDIQRFLDRLYRLPQLPEIELPPGVGRAEVKVEPVSHLEIFSNPQGPSNGNSRRSLTARYWWSYGDLQAKPSRPGRFVTAGEGKTTGDEPGNAQVLIRRDVEREHQDAALLAQLGFRPNPSDDGEHLLLSGKQLPQAVHALTGRGWIVRADQRVVRRSGVPNLSIASGMDWFELRGGVKFETDQGTQMVSLPEILAAARAGKSMIQLGDGSAALLPEEWLAQHEMLATLGTVEEDHLRFTFSQAALLDALLAENELVDVDARFAAAREQLAKFNGVTPLQEPQSFHGSLRTYQREGLGWLAFLRWLGMGGILADDMGLGKTVQILAMFVDRYQTLRQPQGDSPEEHFPSLVVAPRSVVFNWIDEAVRFAPGLRVLPYTGTERQELRAQWSDYDLIITSYGLMRRDITELRQQTFDHVVLDEAQAIKNPTSQSAKAARLLNCRHRVALTGTPVENHLGDLWSIFEFLNPGMLGSSTRFGEMVRTGGAESHSKETAQQTGRALRPFILRRTKKQVLSELPEKTEQTLVCEMEPEQRRVYDQLLKHYRGTLLDHITTPTVGGSTMMVLEALLRLRQAACHPALIDPARENDPSAKLEALIENLAELIDEGHKALVFSQFTSMLALVRKRLDAEGIRYEYLDGQTRDRKTPVERFQNDESVPVFLISLKAGGLGLNLTAAEYVFILDPWWNPAVEQQAIDRAHRIGQTRHVFAYRLICENTVEQRIAQLQDRKRELAEAIIGGEGNVLRNLTREDLQLLLS